jgi:hypothetical protein
VTNPAAVGSVQFALRKTLALRLREGWRALGRPVQIQIAVGAIGLPAILADYAKAYYLGVTAFERVSDVVRAAVLLTFVLGLGLSRVGRSLFLNASDESFLTLAPLPAAARLRHRRDQLVLAAVPAFWLGIGALVPLFWNATSAHFAGGLALWVAGVALTVAWIASVAGLEPEPRRGQALFELVVGTVPALAVWGARTVTRLVVPLSEIASLWVTAALVVAAAVALWALAPRWTWMLARREKTLEWIRVHGTRAGARKQKAQTGLPGYAKGAWAIVRRNALLARRTPAVGGPWGGALALKAIGFAFALAPQAPQPAAVAAAGPPWALAGALLLFGDALLGGALLGQMQCEQPHAFFGTPLKRRAQWLALAGPALVVSMTCALALAAIAALHPEGGAFTARFILVWCGLVGTSLIVTAANLGLASFPQADVAQNLYWIGILVCLMFSAVIPLFGWIVLVAFALYSFRQLRHWGPD